MTGGRCTTAIVTAATLLLFAATTINAERPSVVSATAKIFDSFISPNITAAAAVFTVTYNIPIGIEGNPLTNYKGRTISRDPDDGVTILKTVPNILSASKTAYLKCGSTIFPAMTEAQLLGTGAPIGLIALHPTAEPGTSLLAAMGGAVCEALEWFDDRMSYALLMNGTINGIPFTNQGLTPETLFTEGGCFLQFGVDGQNSLSITNLQTAEPMLPQAVFFNRTEFLCTKEGIQRFTTCRDDHAQHLLDVLSPRLFFSWLTAAHRGSMYEAYTGCRNLLESSIVTKTIYTEYEQAVGCVFQEGTPEYDSSPCCNQALAFTECCAPQRLNVSREVIDVYNVTLPIAECQQNAFKLALDSYMGVRDFAQFDNSHDALLSHATELRFNEVLDEFNTIAEIYRMCQYQSIQTQKRFATDCRTHTDCLLSQVCDVNVGTCKIPWEVVHTSFATCMHNHLPDEVLSSLQALRAMSPQSQSILDTTLQAFTQEMDQRIPLTLLDGQARVSATVHQFPPVLNMTGGDCVGLMSESARSNYTDDVNEWGNWVVVEVPVNVTHCPLAGKICNHNSRYYTDEESCTGAYQTTNYGDHFCAVSDASGTDFRDISTPSGCFAPTYNNSADCIASGNNWFNQSNGFVGCLRPGITTLVGCLGGMGSTRPPCTTHAAAVAAAVAAGTYRYDDASLISHPVCSIRHCYASLSQSNCNLLHTSSTPQWHTTNPFIKVKASAWYNAETSLCIVPLHHFPLLQQTADRCHDFEANFTAAPGAFTPGTFSFHEGYVWREGMWNTKTRCETYGRCALPYLDHQGTTESECREALACPHSCSRCTSSLKDTTTGQMERSMCYDVNALAENACRSPGRWLNYTTTSHLLGGLPETHGICEYPTSDPTACAALNGGTFLTCGDLATQSDCKIAGTTDHTYQFSWIYKALQCAWSVHEPCRSQSECLAEGRCDDEELDVCTCKPGLLCSCQGGSCIETWHVDSVTHAKSKCLLGSPDVVYTRVGCKNLTITSEADCLLAGGNFQWFAKAHTQADCEGHGSGCYGLTSTDQFQGDFLLGRNDTECSKCGSGNTTNHYRWLLGNDDLDSDTDVQADDMKSRLIRYPQQIAKEMFRLRMYQTTSWMPKKWVTSALHLDTLHSSRTEQSGYQLAALVAGTKLQRRLTNHFDRSLPIFAQVAAANWTTSCDETVGSTNPSPIVSHPLFIGRPSARNDFTVETLGTMTSFGCVTDPECTQDFVPGQKTHLKLCQKCPTVNGTFIPACRCRTIPPAPPVPIILPPDSVLGPIPTIPSFASSCNCLLDNGDVYPTTNPTFDVKPFPVTGVSQQVTITAISHVPAGIAALNPLIAFTGVNTAVAPTTRSTIGGLILAVASIFKPTILVATSAIADVPSADLYRNIHSAACSGTKTVGQLAGSCFMISASDISAFPMYVSWSVDPHIVQDAVRYPIADFCASTFLNGPPLNARDALYNGTHISATIPTSGIFCPCLHEDNWETDTDCSSTASTALPVWAIALIAVGAFVVGVISIILIIKYCSGAKEFLTLGKPGYTSVLKRSRLYRKK
jgi:hypothetical protein